MTFNFKDSNERARLSEKARNDEIEFRRNAVAKAEQEQAEKRKWKDVELKAEQERIEQAKKVELNELLKKSDYISIHVPLTEKTHHLISKNELKVMKRNAILINTSRGPVVDERALIKALTSGWIAGAALDVYEKEPIEPHNPLLSLDNVVLTPHIGAGTSECNARIVQTAIENTIRVLQGKKPLFQVREQ